MKTAIIYSSKHGTTETVARRIADRLDSIRDIILVSLSQEVIPDLSLYDDVILGTSFYAGRPMRKMVKFCSKHKSLLEQKTIGLYICGMEKPEKMKCQLEKAYPKELHKQAKAEGMLGGEYLLENLKGIEPYIMKAMKITEPVHKIDIEAIDEFTQKLLTQIKK